MNKFFITLAILLFVSHVYAYENINVIKKENSDSNTTLLVVGGIHGDEPGGYFAASLLATHYKITSKNLWIVPNLNQESIKENSRGLYGDMNRKFSLVAEDDKDKNIIEDIKKVILSKDVSLVLNLHDGNGFYRKKYNGNIFNPTSWGQTCVIDQHELQVEQPFGNLNQIASTVKENMNKNLLEEHHSFDVRNTNSKYDDEAMKLSLTYFAVTNHKPAFAIESSKNLSSLSQKVFYQLLAIEEFMKIMDISFTRSFNLKEEEIRVLLENYGTVTINSNISLNINNVKKYLSYIPIKSKTNVFEFSHPLGDIRRVSDAYIIYIGNKEITTLNPEFFSMASGCPKKFDVEIDGKRTSVNETSDIYVDDYFNIVHAKEFRVNVIGFKAKNSIDESAIDINLAAMGKNFSVDENNKVYRVEFYKDNDFCSMSLVHFK